MTFIGLIQAAEHGGQGAFACTVLAKQRVHFALEELKVDVAVSDDPGKPFRNANRSKGESPVPKGTGLRFNALCHSPVALPTTPSTK